MNKDQQMHTNAIKCQEKARTFNVHARNAHEDGARSKGDVRTKKFHGNCVLKILKEICQEKTTLIGCLKKLRCEDTKCTKTSFKKK